jgi:glycosyltransferase involved in cell wall biosynthesis
MTSGAPVERPAVVVFRKRLLPWSETFIAAQGRGLSRYRPVFSGFRWAQAGRTFLDGEDAVLLEDHSSAPALARAMQRTIGVVGRAYLRALREREPVLVHAHFGRSAEAAIPLARALGVPLVATFHGCDITVTPRRSAERRRRARVFAAATRVIAVSEFIAERLRANGCPADRIVRHYIGVDTERFAPGPDADREPALVLFVGRLVEKKGLTHLLRALPDVQRAVPQAELAIAGDGPLRAAHEAEARAAGVRARFLGVEPPARVQEWMRRATVLCVPSVPAASGDDEGLGMVILEAQASGAPVVISRSGGMPETVVDGVTGLVAPPGDPGALAAHLIALLQDPGRRARFSAAARANVLDTFDLRRQTARLEDIYDDARRVGRGGG